MRFRWRNLLRKGLAAAVLASLLLSSTPTHAANQIPKLLNYQARITNASGVPVADGNLNIWISVYNASSGGTCLYAMRGSCGTPSFKTVTVVDGVFSTLIGDTASGDVEIPESLFDNNSLFLGVTVASDTEMVPRKRIAAAPYSLNSDKLDDLDLASSGSTTPYVVGTTVNGNLVITGDPQGGTVSTGAFYLNPAGASASETLFGIADNGTNRWMLDKEGDITHVGSLLATAASSTSQFIFRGAASQSNEIFEVQDSLTNRMLSVSATATTIGSTSSTDAVVFNSRVGSNLTPTIDNTYSLGDYNRRWKDLWLSGGSANIAYDMSGTSIARIGWSDSEGRRVIFQTPSEVPIHIRSGASQDTETTGIYITPSIIKLMSYYVNATPVTDGAITYTNTVRNNTTAYNASPIAGLSFANKTTDTGLAHMGGIAVAKENTTFNNALSYMALYTRAAGGVTEALRISSSQNVGIGFTTAATSKLQVCGNSSCSASDAITVGNDVRLADYDTANAMSINGVANSAIGSIRLGSSGGTISGDSGNIGIGDASPDFFVDVEKSQNASTFLTVNNPTAGTAAIAGLYATNNTGEGVSLQALSSSYTTSGINIANYGSLVTDSLLAGLVLGTAGASDPLLFATAAVERARFDGSGNFGIGDASPDFFVDVEKSQNAATTVAVNNPTSGTAATAGFYAVNNTGGGVSFQALSSSFTTVGTAMANFGLISTDSALGGLVVTSGGVGDPLILGSAQTERARFDGEGDFGIGNDAPANRLTVGNATSTFEVNAGGNIVRINAVAYSWPASQGGASTVLQNNGSGVLSWAAAAGLATLQTAYDSSTGTTEIFLGSARGALTLADSFSSFGGNLFEIQDRTNGAGDYSRRYFTVSSTSTLINPSALATYEVGIGTTTPDALLHVEGAISTSNNLFQMTDSTASGGYLKITDGTSIGGQFAPTIWAKGVGTGFADRSGLMLIGEPGEDGADDVAITLQALFGAGALVNAPIVRISNNGTVMAKFEANGDFDVDTNTLFVDASANSVGIGDTTPDTILDVESTSAQLLALNRTSTSVGEWRFTVTNDPTGGGGIYSNGSLTILGQTASTDFGIRAGSSGNPQLTVLDSGEVGIGNVAPANRLTVGNATSTFEVNAGGNIVRINAVPYSWPSSQGGASTVLQNNGSGTLTWASASGLTNLNQAYLSSTSTGAFAEISITPSLGALTIADTFSGTGNIFEIQDRTNATGDYSRRYLTVSATSTLINPGNIGNYRLTLGAGSIFQTDSIQLFRDTGTGVTFLTDATAEPFSGGWTFRTLENGTAYRFENGDGTTRYLSILASGNVGIGNTAPANRLTVGSATSTFEVDASGNILKINNIVYSWPSSQGGASTVLTNNGSGVLTWSAAGATTLQQAYDNDANGGDVTITTNSTDGQLIIAGTQNFRLSTTFFNIGQTTDPTASNVTLHDFVLDTDWTGGTMIRADFGTTTTQTSDIIGSSFNFLNNLTTAAQAVTGYEVYMPVVTTSTFGNSYYGFNIPQSGKLTQNATGTILAWAGLNMAFPDTQENTGSGILSATGVNIVGSAVGTQTGARIGVAVDLGTSSGGSVTGINLISRGNSAATEQAILISDNWDNVITFQGTGQNSIGIGNGGNLVFRDGLGGSNFLMQLTDGGTKGNLSVTGNLAIGSSSDTDTVDFTNARIASNLTPSSDNTLDLGDYNKRWKTLHVGPGSVIVHNDATGTTKLTLGFSGTTPRLFSDSTSSLTLDSSNGTVAIASGDNLSVVSGNLSIGGSTAISASRQLLNITDIAAGGTLEFNRTGSGNTNIGDISGAGTITIGNNAGGNLILSDPQWSITGAGVATFASIGGNLLPSSAPTVGATSQTATLLDTNGGTGSFAHRTSVAIGVDGLPVIAYYDSGNLDLRVIKCGNAACSSGNTTTTVDSTGDVGQYASIAIGTDGFPVISYLNNVSEDSDLKVVKCGNAACSSGNTVSTAASTNDVGYASAIAIGVDGFPVISHYETFASTGLYVTHCGNAACSSGNVTTLQDSAGTPGSSSIAIGTDGMPVIAYRGTSTSLSVWTCTTITCSSGGATALVEDVANVLANALEILIGQDGRPVIAYNDASAANVKVAKCGDAKCSTGNTLTLVASGTRGDGIAMAIGPDGLPVISYRLLGASNDLMVTKCGNDSCSSGSTETTVESTNSVGLQTSIAIGTDGLPFITHYDTTNTDLRSVKCADPGCKETSSSSVTGGVNVGSLSSYFRSVYAHTFWGKQFQIAGFDVAETYRVEDASVSAGDIVRIAADSTGASPTVEKSSAAYDAAIGVVSTKPAIKLSEWEDDADVRPIAMDGRVPTKVNLENGAIKAGDPITSSSVAGVGMKSTKPGMIVGYALEAWNGPGQGVIEVFVKPVWHSGLAITTDGVKSLFNDDFAFLPPAYATETQTAIASRELSFIGSAWDAASSTSVTRSITTGLTVTDTSNYQLAFKNDAGQVLATLNQMGDLALAGSLTVNGGFDYAETFPSTPDLEAGDIVMVDPSNTNGYGVKKTAGAYENSVIGVISTKPGFLTGKKEENTQPVALAGRVPVKVNMESGSINPGDPITSSSTPGVGMKATEPGRVIGIALQGAASEGTILIFVNPSWWNGPTPVSGSMAEGTLNITQDSLLDFKNSVLSNVAAIISTNGTWSITSDGILAAKKVEAEEVKTEAMTVKQTDQYAAVGEGVVPIGYDAVVIHNPAMKPSSEVFISFRGDAGGASWVAERGEGDFTVHLSKPAAGDLTFAYWIVGVEDVRTPETSDVDDVMPPANQETDPAPSLPDSSTSTPPIEPEA